jgi:sensor histidine kinase YesM
VKKAKRSYYTADSAGDTNRIIAVMKFLLKFLNKHKIHLIGWTLFILSEIFIIGLATGVFGNIASYAIHYFINILLFYTCGHWLYPLIFQTRYHCLWKFPLLCGASFAVYLFFNYLIDTEILKNKSWYLFENIDLSRRYVFGVLWRALIFMGGAGFYYLFLVHLKEIQSRRKAEKDSYVSLLSEREMEVKLGHAVNSYLKAQINPHLLFNTLSLIYQDILEHSPKAADTIMTLSDLMRYSINCEFTEPTVPLKEEIEQVKSLIKIHQNRFDNEISLSFSYGTEIEQTRFIPLVLITLAENIFKHGIYQDPAYPAELTVSMKDRILTIMCRNLPNRKNNITSMNTGLENIRQRLHLTYGNAAKINFGLNEGYFEVTISLELPESDDIQNNNQN